MERRKQLYWLMVLVYFSITRDLSMVSALSINVEGIECVYEYVPSAGDTVSGNFVVVDYESYWDFDFPGLDFTVTDPKGNTLHSIKGTIEDKFEFKAPESGMYKFCFHNHESTIESVSFYIHSGHIPSERDVVTNEHLTPMLVRMAELKEALESVRAEQKYLKARDSRHRYTNESTKRRVIFYTVLEYIVLVLLSGLQVLYIRRLFNRSIAYNRISRILWGHFRHGSSSIQNFTCLVPFGGTGVAT